MAAQGDLFVIGAGSVVGRLMRAAWRGGPVRWCARRGAVDAVWDLADGAEALAREIGGARAVLCLAGATPGATDFSVNVRLAEVVSRAANLAGCEQLLFASTMAVYGAGSGPFTEDGATKPLAEYGRSKRAMEEAVLGANGVTALRLGNVVGADMLFRNIVAGREILIDQFSDGTTPRRSYIDPAQLAALVAGLIGRAVPPVLNVAARPALAMGDLANAAGVAWQARAAPESALPLAEMDLRALDALLDVPEADAAAMVARWRETLR